MKYLIFLITLFVSLGGFAQVPLPGETLPEFPGGRKGLSQFLDKNIHYPEKTFKEKKEGRVMVTMTILPDGRADSVHITASFTPECDKEVLRAMKKLPRWKPGTRNGEPSPMKITLPIEFAMKANSRR